MHSEDGFRWRPRFRGMRQYLQLILLFQVISLLNTMAAGGALGGSQRGVRRDPQIEISDMEDHHRPRDDL